MPTVPGLTEWIFVLARPGALPGAGAMHRSMLALVGTSATVVPQPAAESILAKRSAEAMAAVFGIAAAGRTEPPRRHEDGKGGHAGASWGARRGSVTGGGGAAEATSAAAVGPPETTTYTTMTWGPRGGLGGWGTTTEMTTRKRVRNADGSYTSESLMGVELRHHPEKGTVSIELSEAAVLMLYLSGIAARISGTSNPSPGPGPGPSPCPSPSPSPNPSPNPNPNANPSPSPSPSPSPNPDPGPHPYQVLISGISVGCCLWQRNLQKKKDEACECPCCSGLYKERYKLGTGGFGEAALVHRAG